MMRYNLEYNPSPRSLKLLLSEYSITVTEKGSQATVQNTVLPEAGTAGLHVDLICLSGPRWQLSRINYATPQS